MKQKLELEDGQGIEIIKAVAQAWYSHSGSSKPMKEFHAHKKNFKGKPSRFKLEDMKKSLASSISSTTWDFRQSLWDSYEIVTLSKMLEAGLVFDNPIFTELDGSVQFHWRRRESKNSLRNLFNQMSSRRFNEANTPRTSGSQS